MAILLTAPSVPIPRSAKRCACQLLCTFGGIPQHLSILLVEPNEEVRNLQRSWLENDGGWCIDEADAGGRALERISADFGILVMARFLPDMTDAEFLRRVDETAFQGWILHCRTVGTFDEEEYPGVDSSISKPLFESEFVQVVRDIVDTVSPE